MRMKHPIRKATFAVIIAGAVTIGFAGATGSLASAQSTKVTSLAAVKQSAASQNAQALQTLNSFYKPALKGQFPGLKGLTVGQSTRQNVVKAIGKPEQPGQDADAFDVYHAEMGHPGYAISYKLNKIREMRYFGTNVERQTNIGGITLKMLVKQWGVPNASVQIKSGHTKQQKVTYVRDKYQLEFIFNSSTDLDHINLKQKPAK